MKTIEDIIEDFWESAEKGEAEFPTEARYDFYAVERLMKAYAISVAQDALNRAAEKVQALPNTSIKCMIDPITIIKTEIMTP
jgi:hypothetical protein